MNSFTGLGDLTWTIELRIKTNAFNCLALLLNLIPENNQYYCNFDNTFISLPRFGV